jgi:hypothetical protein
MAYEQPQKETKTFPLKVLVDRYSKKVVFVEATKDFVDTLFSFLSLPMFLVTDDLKIVPSSMLTSTQILKESRISNLFYLKEVTHNIGKQEVMVLCFYFNFYVSGSWC